MRLCDTDIERYLDDGIISLTPRPENDKINGATIDVRLGNSFRVFREHSAPYIDLSGPKEEVSAQLESVMSDEIIIGDDESRYAGVSDHIGVSETPCQYYRLVRWSFFTCSFRLNGACYRSSY